MANEEQLRLLKEGGVREWNAWREENPRVEIDLSEAKLNSADLHLVNLRFANLRNTDLQSVDFSHADLQSANLRSANLNSANLSDASLIYADLSDAIMNETILCGADFFSSSLFSTKFSNNLFTEANFTDSVFYNTSLGKAVMLKIEGLDVIRHLGPSTLGQDTLKLSQGQLPEIFLKGCGLNDWEIAASKLYNPDLTPRERIDLLYKIDRLQTEKPFQTRQVFISYARADEHFIERIEQKFNEGGIRYWRDVHDATAGRLDKIIDRAIEQNQIFLLVLSERSVNSDWVEMEATKARKMEKKLKREVICPVALDDSWKEADWSADLRTQIEKYNILDFSQWEDEAYFEQQYTKLLDGLNLFYLRG